MFEQDSMNMLEFPVIKERLSGYMRTEKAASRARELAPMQEDVYKRQAGVGDAELVVQVVFDEIQGAAIGGGHQNHMAVGAHEVHDGAADGAHARGEAQRAVAALQGRDLALGDVDGLSLIHI